MEFINNIFIPIEIIEVIFKKNNDYNTKKNFYQVNKITYQHFFKDTEFYSLERNLNLNYLKFYHLLNKYDYQTEDMNYLKQIISKSIHFNIIWENNQSGFIDTRYIFELMYHTDLVTEYTLAYINNKYFYKHFYKNIKQCITKNNRHIMH